ncbi:MAG: hypothetical protein AB7O62_03600 [Pirellulales bacterium]
MEIILEVLGWLVVAFYQALAGVLWPVQSPEIRRVQRAAGVFLSLAVLGMAGAWLMPLAGKWTLILFAISAVLLAIAGVLGSKVEKSQRVKSPGQE